MTSPKYQVRRATLDDVGALTALWKLMGYAVDDLARRITEFQVVATADGEVVGALGIQIAERQGLIHSETFSDFSLADAARPLLWDRVSSVAANHGLLRLWTREQAPFWGQCGLAAPDAETLQKLPAAWRGTAAPWLTLKLKDDLQQIISADKEFLLFMESEKQRSQRALQQAKILKFLATLLAFALLGVVLVGAYYVFRKNPTLLHRQR